jgi:hypothetical protein
VDARRRLGLPEDHSQRVELVDGSLVVSPMGEVISPSTRVNDLVLKRRLYAEAGVPFYLVVDPNGTTYLLEPQGAEYVEIARESDGAMTLDRPFPVTIGLSG